MIGTTEMIVIGVVAFLLFGGAIFGRAMKQITTAKKEAKKAIDEIMADEDKKEKLSTD